MRRKYENMNANAPPQSATTPDGRLSVEVLAEHDDGRLAHAALGVVEAEPMEGDGVICQHAAILRDGVTIRGMVHAHRETAAARSRGALILTLTLTGGYMVVELVGAVRTRNLAPFADAVPMFTDVGGLALALFAIWIAARPPTRAKTYRY